MSPASNDMEEKVILCIYTESNLAVYEAAAMLRFACRTDEATALSCFPSSQNEYFQSFSGVCIEAFENNIVISASFHFTTSPTL